MLLKETIRVIVREQRENLLLFEYGTARELRADIHLHPDFAVIVSGIRRCGKSTLLRQVMKSLDRFYYFNFEDPRATGFEADDFEKLDHVLTEEYGAGDVYFLDEIQNVTGWEIFVRNMLDKKKRFLITGSNASLLSRELGKKLTGRHLRFELFPFSFTEFLAFVSQKPGVQTFENYLRKGGFPGYLKIGKTEILQELFSDIIERDIVARYRLKGSKKIKEIAIYLLTNAGKEFSYSGLANLFGLGSVNTAIDFVSYLEDSYLLFTVPKFDYSMKKQLVNPKKIYSVDNGLSAANSASFSSDKGRMLENTVFQALRRKYRAVFYFREQNECDFVVKEANKISLAIQVCYELNEDNKTREINGLLEALQKFDLPEGLVLTYDQEDEFKINSKRIIVLSVWKWLLEQTASGKSKM